MIPRRAPLVTGLPVALAVFVGCASDGRVLIQNETGTELTGEVDGRGIALSGFESIELSIKIGTRVLIFGPDSKDVSFSGESCTLFPFADLLKVSRGDVRRVTLGPDAVCVIAQNQSEREVVTVQKRLGDTEEWEPNLVDDVLFPTEAIRLRLEPARYDFRMIDDCPETTTVIGKETLARGAIKWVTHVAGQDGCVLP